MQDQVSAYLCYIYIFCLLTDLYVAITLHDFLRSRRRVLHRLHMQSVQATEDLLPLSTTTRTLPGILIKAQVQPFLRVQLLLRLWIRCC